MMRFTWACWWLRPFGTQPMVCLCLAWLKAEGAICARNNKREKMVLVYPLRIIWALVRMIRKVLGMKVKPSLREWTTSGRCWLHAFGFVTSDLSASFVNDDEWNSVWSLLSCWIIIFNAIHASQNLTQLYRCWGHRYQMLDRLECSSPLPRSGHPTVYIHA